jgi:hypothetical protein
MNTKKWFVSIIIGCCVIMTLIIFLIVSIVKEIYKGLEFEIHLSETINGSVVVPHKVKKGEDFEIIIIPDGGYMVASLVIDARNVTTKITNGKYVYQNVIDDVYIKVLFKESVVNSLVDKVNLYYQLKWNTYFYFSRPRIK